MTLTKLNRLRSFNKLKSVHSYDLTNTIVKMKNKTNLFNNQLASNIKIQSFLKALRGILFKKNRFLSKFFHESVLI